MTGFINSLFAIVFADEEPIYPLCRLGILEKNQFTDFTDPYRALKQS